MSRVNCLGLICVKLHGDLRNKDDMERIFSQTMLEMLHYQFEIISYMITKEFLNWDCASLLSPILIMHQELILWWIF